MSANKDTKSVSTATYVVDDAVGVAKSYWFIAIVNHNSERKVAEKLDELGIVNYLPTQREYRVWKNGRKSKVDKIVIPSMVFVSCTEQQRLEIVRLPYINRFMTNKSSTHAGSIQKSIATIPDNQIDLLKFMLGQSDIPVVISAMSFKTGDKVRVIRGSLIGLEGDIINLNPTQTEFVVALDVFGCAKLSIDSTNVEVIK